MWSIFGCGFVGIWFCKNSCIMWDYNVFISNISRKLYKNISVGMSGNKISPTFHFIYTGKERFERRNKRLHVLLDEGHCIGSAASARGLDDTFQCIVCPSEIDKGEISTVTFTISVDTSTALLV